MEKVDLNKLSFDDLQKEVKKLEESKIKVVSKEKHWEIGTNYLIRTVTHIQLGKLIDINDKEIFMENASWIADTGRFNEMLRKGIETLDSSEIEPFENMVIINRSALIDATKYKHELPNGVK